MSRSCAESGDATRRQGDNEFAAAARPRARGAYCATVKRHELPRDGQTQTQAILRTGVARSEWFEHVWKEIGGNAPSCIANLQDCFIRSFRHIERESSTQAGVSDTIQQKV